MNKRFLNITLCAAALAFAPLASAADIAIEPGKEKGTISIPTFERIMKENPSQIVVVDVRDDREFKKGSMPGAINVPVGDIEKKMGELPKDKPVIFVCPTGARSGEAYDTVMMLDGGVKAYFVDADITFSGGNQYSIKAR
ncbi:MAG: rhodanese-like domain-containing protein [Thiobacillus sp.]|nr:rhodanese-like domain-containing protein [Thiobacillus sp.]MDP2977475.1 rhodanese-like domain-containing protein [Thiobacillus sp.]